MDVARQPKTIHVFQVADDRISFHNNFQTALACGHYSVLSSMFAVRN